MANNGKGQINVLPWRNHQKNHSDTSWRKKNQMQARHLGYHIQLRKNTRMLWPLSETWMSWSPPSLNNDGDGGSTGAEAILNKLLHRQRWPLHHFPCCDPVQHQLTIQTPYPQRLLPRYRRRLLQLLHVIGLIHLDERSGRFWACLVGVLDEFRK